MNLSEPERVENVLLLLLFLLYSSFKHRVCVFFSPYPAVYFYQNEDISVLEFAKVQDYLIIVIIIIIINYLASGGLLIGLVT